MIKKDLIWLNCLVSLLIFSSCNNRTNSGANEKIKIDSLIDQINSISGEFPDSAFRINHYLLLLNPVSSNDSLLSDCYSRMGNYFIAKKQNDSALYYHIKAMELRTHLRNPLPLSKSLNNIGIIYKNNGDYTTALDYFLKSLAIKEQLNDTLGLIKSDYSIGELYEHLKNFETGNKYHKTGLELASAINDSISMAQGELNIGNVLLETGNYNEAIQRFELAAKYYTSQDNQSALSGVYANTGVCYQFLQQLDSAAKFQDLALQIRMDNDLQDDLAESYNNLGEIAILQGNYDLAITLLKYSQRLADSLRLYEIEIENYKSLASVFSLRKNVDSAFIYQEKYDTALDSIFAQASNATTAQINYLNQKNLNIKMASDESLLSAKTKTREIAGSLIIFISVVTGFALIQRRNARRKIELQEGKIQSLLTDQELKALNAMLEGQDNERRRISEDLHDRVGSILSTAKMYLNAIDLHSDRNLNEAIDSRTKAFSLLGEAIDEVRQISHDLISGTLMNFGLEAALKELVSTINGAGQMKAELFVFGIDGRMDSKIELVIYRVIQELISNVMRHSKASEVNIHLTKNQETLNVLVEDNGIGFIPEEKSEGIGFRNIQSRIDPLAGRFRIDSSPTKGSTIIIDIPL